METRQRIKSYNKVWKIENRIYAIQNIALPVPIKPRELLYFFIIAGIAFILNLIIPLLRIVPPILKFAIFPIALSQFLLKKKLDGKMPQKYMYSWLVYMFTKGQYIERFREIPENKDEVIKLSWLCIRGNIQDKRKLDGCNYQEEERKCMTAL